MCTNPDPPKPEKKQEERPLRYLLTRDQAEEFGYGRGPRPFAPRAGGGPPSRGPGNQMPGVGGSSGLGIALQPPRAPVRQDRNDGR
jgi:hypothetical protein